MKSWQREPDGILSNSLKLTALMSFCFGVGLLASSIIGAEPRSQLAETIIVGDGLNLTSNNTSIYGELNRDAGTSNTIIVATATTPSTQSSTISGGSSSSNFITPTLTFTSAIPAIVASDFSITLNAVAVQSPRLQIRGLNLNKIINLEPSSQQPPIFNFLVRFELLPVGRYEVVAKAYLPNGSLIEVVGQRFEVLAPVTNQTLSPNPTSATSSTSIGTSATDTPITVIERPEQAEVPELDLIIPSQLVYNGFVPVSVRTSVSLPEAFIYLQSANFLTPRFVGKARYYNGSTLLLMVDTHQIPNGEHRIYAVAKLTDTNVESEKRRFTIFNATTTTALSPTSSTTSNPNLTTQPIIPLLLTPLEQNNPTAVAPAPVYVPPKFEPKEEVKDGINLATKNELVDSGSNNNPKSVTLSDELKILIPQILKEYEQEINERLKTFGKDLHADDADINNLRKKAEDDLMAILLDDYRLGSTSAEARKHLRIEVVRLVTRAEKVEILIKKAEVNSASIDESIKAFSEATGSNEETLVDTSSPREFGLVREDILKIESVSPILSVDVVSTTTKIYTEIRGRAIPKSLVTLYIYSTPVMVTVRADADGTFLYVYEKDLEDGDHEVYVALTTTKGDVVVKSPGFQFIREAQAFNSPDSSNGDILVPDTAGTPLTKNPYFIVLSITLLVVSFVFFLLGFQSVRKSGVNKVM